MATRLQYGAIVALYFPYSVVLITMFPSQVFYFGNGGGEFYQEYLKVGLERLIIY